MLTLKQFQFWQDVYVNWTVKRTTVLVSGDGVGFAPIGEFTLDSTPSSTDIVPLNGVVCRYVRLAMRENGAGEEFYLGVPTEGGNVGIAEVAFEAYVSP